MIQDSSLLEEQGIVRVSVIIPCYNHAHYLSYAIRSILDQTFTDWEAIIVDDGSTDSTSEVVATFTDSRIRYIYQENQGLSAARNTGIRTAMGKYLAFLDADDEWEPSFLERCVSVLETDPGVGGVYARNYFIDLEGQKLPRLGGKVVRPERFRARLLESGFFPAHAMVVRAAVLQEVGLFDRELTSLEDWDLWLRASARYLFKGIDEPLVRYRVYPGSMSTNASRMHASRLAVLAKYFGLPEGDVSTWPKDKRRAYGFAYRSGGLGYIIQGQPEEGWQLITQAVSIWPLLLERLDTFYELMCGDQPRGYRGQVDSLNIEENGAEMLFRLELLFAYASKPELALKGVAFGKAYLALAMLNDQAGRWKQAKAYLLRAIAACPVLLLDMKVVRRLVKLYIGKQTISWLRQQSHSFSWISAESD